MTGQSTDRPVAVAYAPDLMDRSRISGVPGADVRFVTSPAELAAMSADVRADLVVVDLGRPGVLDAIAAGDVTGRIVGFGSHVDGALLDAAREVGCHEVLPRSRFFARLGEILCP